MHFLLWTLAGPFPTLLLSRPNFLPNLTLNLTLLGTNQTFTAPFNQAPTANPGKWYFLGLDADLCPR